MKTCCAGKNGRSLLGKGDTGGWLVSGGLLLLIPKCPVCLAGYIAAFSGLGLSVPAASGLRWTLLAICMSSLALLSFRLVRRALGCAKTRSPFSQSVEVTGIDPKNPSNSRNQKS